MSNGPYCMTQIYDFIHLELDIHSLLFDYEFQILNYNSKSYFKIEE